MLFRSDIAGYSSGVKGRSARLFRSGEHLAAAQHGARVADPPGGPHLIEVFEDLNRHTAAEAAMALEGRGGECALGRAVGKLARDFGEVRKGLGQKEPVVGDPATRPNRSARLRKRSTAVGSSSSAAASSRIRGARRSASARSGR